MYGGQSLRRPECILSFSIKREDGGEKSGIEIVSKVGQRNGRYCRSIEDVLRNLVLSI